ncbi:MAG: carboxypeptidase-like regulatory domain-containing protein [Vicinamibacterales bacterium]
MTNRTQSGFLALVFAMGLTGCEGASPVSPTPSASREPTPSFPTAPLPSPVSATPTLIMFTEPGTGFSTSEVRDVQEQVLQLNTANELIWAADGTRLQGFRVEGNPRASYIVGKICAEGCAFEVRFGTKNGEKRAYLTADYGHDNPGTLVDVEVSGGALVVSRTSVFVPGSFTLSGVVTEATPTGNVPVEGVFVYLAVSGQVTTADRHGFYTMLGMVDGTETVATSKEGYTRTEHKNVSIKGDTRFDIQLVRQSDVAMP